MRIKEVALNNFRSHRSTKITGMGKFVVLLGLNGAGKSTILDAIAYALTGVCRGVDDRGVGGEHLVTSFAADADQAKKPKSFGVSVVADKGTIVRGLGEGPRAKVQAEIGRKFGVDPEVARILVQTGAFTRLKPAEQKAVVLSLAGSKVSAEDILALLGPSASAFDATSVPLESVEAIDKADRDLRAVRPELKREIAAVVVPEAQEGLADVAKSIQAAEADLRELRAERDAAVRAASDYSSRRSSAADEDRRLKAEYDSLGEQDGSFERLPKLQAELTELQEEDAERQKKYGELRSSVDTLSGQIETLRQQHGAFAKLKGSCPTCQRVITKTDSDAVTKNLKTAAQKINAELEPKKAELEKLAYDSKAGARILELRGLVDRASRAKAAAEQAGQRRALIEKRRGEVAKILGQAAPAAADVAAMEADITAGEGYLAKQRESANAEQSRAAAANRKADLERRLVNLEELIEKLGPKGPVRAKLMEGGGDELMAEVNAFAVVVGLPEITVEAGGAFTVYVGGLPAALLSASEEYRLNLAFGAAIAKRSGAGIIFLDGAEILDGDNRAAVNDVLEKAGLEQAFLAATPTDMPDFVPVEDKDWTIYGVTKTAGVSAVSPMPSAGRVAAAA